MPSKSKRVKQEAESVKKYGEGTVKMMEDVAQLYNTLAKERNMIRNLVYQTVRNDELKKGSSKTDADRIAEEVQNRFDNAAKLIIQLNEYLHSEDSQKAIYEKYMTTISSFGNSLKELGMVDAQGMLTSTTNVVGSMMQFTSDMNDELRSGIYRQLNEVADELGNIGIKRGGLSGASRMGGDMAEAAERFFTKVGEAARIGEADPKKLNNIYNRLTEGYGANPAEAVAHGVAALGRGEAKMIISISEAVLRLLPDGTVVTGKLSEEALDLFTFPIKEALDKMHASEVVESEVSELLKGDINAKVGYASSSNIEITRLFAFLHPEMVTETMITDMEKYISLNDWCMEHLKKYASKTFAVMDPLKYLEGVREKSKRTMDPKEIAEISREYVSIWKKVNMAWIDYFIKDGYDRDWLRGELNKVTTLLDCKAFGRRLTNYYIAKMPSAGSVFKLSETEIKFLKKYGERNRRIVDFTGDDALWASIEYKINKKLQEQAMEKNKGKSVNLNTDRMQPMEGGAESAGLA